MSALPFPKSGPDPEQLLRELEEASNELWGKVQEDQTFYVHDLRFSLEGHEAMSLIVVEGTENKIACALLGASTEIKSGDFIITPQGQWGGLVAAYFSEDDTQCHWIFKAEKLPTACPRYGIYQVYCVPIRETFFPGFGIAGLEESDTSTGRRPSAELSPGPY